MLSIKFEGIEYRFYDHLFAVSSCGKALRKLSPFIPSIRSDGYVTLGRRRLMHRVVAICWIPNDDISKHVHHINGIKYDNRAENLLWVTPKEHIGGHHEHSSYIRTDKSRDKCKAYRTGKKDSDETKLKKCVSLDKYRNKTACKYDGIDYPTIKQGAAAAGLLYGTFKVRCLSKNFPNYELLKN